MSLLTRKIFSFKKKAKCKLCFMSYANPFQKINYAPDANLKMQNQCVLKLVEVSSNCHESFSHSPHIQSATKPMGTTSKLPFKFILSSPSQYTLIQAFGIYILQN